MSTSSKTAQTNTPRRTYDNAFLDSIAQAHPSLVINKSSPPQASKIIKGKKPIKKAALVKPMMAEDRSIGVGMEKSGPDPPNLVPITTNDIASPPPPPSPQLPPPVPPSSVVSRVQTIQLTPQKQQVSSRGSHNNFYPRNFFFQLQFSTAFGVQSNRTSIRYLFSN